MFVFYWILSAIGMQMVYFCWLQFGARFNTARVRIKEENPVRFELVSPAQRRLVHSENGRILASAGNRVVLLSNILGDLHKLQRYMERDDQQRPQ